MAQSTSTTPHASSFGRRWKRRLLAMGIAFLAAAACVFVVFVLVFAWQESEDAEGDLSSHNILNGRMAGRWRLDWDHRIFERDREEPLEIAIDVAATPIPRWTTDPYPLGYRLPNPMTGSGFVEFDSHRLPYELRTNHWFGTSLEVSNPFFRPPGAEPSEMLVHVEFHAEEDPQDDSLFVGFDRGLGNGVSLMEYHRAGPPR